MSAQDYMFALGRLSFYAATLLEYGDPVHSIDQVHLLADHFKNTAIMLDQQAAVANRESYVPRPTPYLGRHPYGAPFAPAPHAPQAAASPPPAVRQATPLLPVAMPDGLGSPDVAGVAPVAPVLETQRGYTGNKRGRIPKDPGMQARIPPPRQGI